jgi:hypothetical protein
MPACLTPHPPTLCPVVPLTPGSAPPETYFTEISGTLKRKHGQKYKTQLCSCCPPTRFGVVDENDKWTIDVERAVGWKNPQVMRTSRKEFLKACNYHVNSKNGLHRF